MSIIPLELPIVRTRRLPADGALRWRETGDYPAAIVVFVIAVLGLALGAGALAQVGHARPGTEQVLIIVALVLLVVCAVALFAAIAEFTRVHTVAVDNGLVHCSFRQLGRRVDRDEPLQNYRGLLILDRSRRLFIRNQDHPITGRRGPVTEFVVVLRHRSEDEHERELDVELFRAQPSLETLLTMHRMQDAASGPAGAANAGACAQLAASYRHALSSLCERLDMPVLIVDAHGALHEWPVQTLDEWLQPQ